MRKYLLKYHKSICATLNTFTSTYVCQFPLYATPMQHVTMFTGLVFSCIISYQGFECLVYFPVFSFYVRLLFSVYISVCYLLSLCLFLALFHKVLSLYISSCFVLPLFVHFLPLLIVCLTLIWFTCDMLPFPPLCIEGPCVHWYFGKIQLFLCILAFRPTQRFIQVLKQRKGKQSNLSFNQTVCISHSGSPTMQRNRGDRLSPDPFAKVVRFWTRLGRTSGQ